MSKIILFGGQGNTKVSDLSKIYNSREGKDILNTISQSNPSSYEYLGRIISGKVSINESHASMLSTFVYNWWQISKIDLSEIEYFSSHSAGIFNVAFSSNSVELSDILKFIEKRSKMIEEQRFREEMWLALTQNVIDLEKVVSKISDYVKVSIRIDTTSEVLSFSEENKNKLEELAGFFQVHLKLKKLGLRVPYHTGFLSKLNNEYDKLVDDLHIKQNNSFRYIYETDTLQQEIKHQLDHTFDWNKIMKEIVQKNLEVYDLSPNKFISKNFKKISNSIKIL